MQKRLGGMKKLWCFQELVTFLCDNKRKCVLRKWYSSLLDGFSSHGYYVCLVDIFHKDNESIFWFLCLLNSTYFKPIVFFVCFEC